MIAEDSSKPLRPAISLRVWIPLSLAVFVLLGSLSLLFVFARQRRVEEIHAFENLARVNSGFIERTRLPLTPKMAKSLSEIIGAEVFFWEVGTHRIVGGALDEGFLESLRSLMDGQCHILADERMMVGHNRGDGVYFVFLRARMPDGLAVVSRNGWLALGAFWVLSLGLGLGLSKWVAQPLRRMVDVLPSVGTDCDLVGLPLGRGDEIGRLAKVLGDTHQSLREERDLRRKAERHAILGKMAASLAHEVRNPIAAIRLHAQLLDADAPNDFELSRGLIVSESERLEDLVGQWMSYARPEPPRLVTVDLPAMLSEAVRLITPQAMHAGVVMDLQTADDGKTIEILADRNRLMQVFGNLLRNAVQAMPSGGRVAVVLQDNKDRVVVMISDQGEGFSENALKHLGEPFFSEKEGGMGLGLAVVKDICEAHGGSIEAENPIGGGACIRVAFLKSPTMNSGES